MPSRPPSPLLPRAVDLASGDDVVEAVATLRRERTFELQAAYASAIRRRHDGPGYRRAAELLETVLLARRRRALDGPRLLARAEVLLPLYVGLHLVHVLLFWRLFGALAGLLILAVYTVGAVAFVVWLRRRRHDVVVDPAALDGGRGDLERWSLATAAVLALAEAGTDDPQRLVEEADDHARGLGAPLVGAAAIAEAERRVAASELPRLRDLRDVLAAARACAVARAEVAALRPERRRHDRA